MLVSKLMLIKFLPSAEGHIAFKATCEGQTTKPQHPDHYITYEDDSQSSGSGAPSPALEGSRSQEALDEATALANNNKIVTVSLIPGSGTGSPLIALTSSNLQNELSSKTLQTMVVTAEQAQHLQLVAQEPSSSTDQAALHTRSFLAGSSSAAAQGTNTTTTTASSISNNNNSSNLMHLAPAPSPMSLGSTTSSLSPLSNVSIASPPSVQPPPASITPKPRQSSPAGKSDAPGKDKNRKKSKSKSQPKTRTIKFHEYKVRHKKCEGFFFIHEISIT